MVKNKLLILGGTSQNQGLLSLEQAKATGFEAIFTDLPQSLQAAPELCRLADEVYPLDFNDAQACIDWVSNYADRSQLIGVFSFKEKAQKAVAALVDHFGFCGPSEKTHRLMSNKYRCREHLRRAGFAQPGSVLCTSVAQLREGASGSKERLIVKPMQGYASEDVFLINGQESLELALRYVTPSHERPFVLESFVDGVEYSAEGLLVQGRPRVLSLTKKSIIGNGNFVESGHLAPAPMDESTQASAVQTVERAIATVGLEFGMFHAEFWIRQDETVVMGEVHSRPGGDYITHLTQYVTGLKYYGRVFAQLTEPDADVVQAGQAQYRAAAIRYILPKPGVVTAIRGVEVARALPGVVNLLLAVQVGDIVPPVRNSFDRVGHAITVGATPEEAERRLHEVVNAVEIVTENEQGGKGDHQ